jgi:ubiquinone/menaquinone biosynthesis C-methylase UbiE
MAAALGHPATGVDIAGSALAIARQKAEARGIGASFIRWDATELGALGRTWPTALDCGLFHIFDDADRARYVRSLAAAIDPGGQLAMLAFSDRQIGTTGPRRVTQAEIRVAFAEGWTIRSIEPTILETRVPFDPAASEAGQHGAQAWLSIIERVPPAGSG